MRSKSNRNFPTVGLTSRREVLRRGAAIAAVSIIAPTFPRFARAQSASTTFDYYISTSGNDANPGTLSQPWAISSLCRYKVNSSNQANNAAIAGKRVGILPGTYSVGTYISLAASNTSGDPGYAPGLSIPMGDPSSPTYIASSSSSGVYSVGVATIDGQSEAVQASTIGQSDDIYPNQGYVTLDGLVILNPPNSGHNVIFGGSENSTPTIQGITVQNCEFKSQNFTNMVEGNNGSCVELCGVRGALIHNNYFYDFTPPSFNPSNDMGGHMTATQQWFSQLCIYEYNTCIGPGFFGKETNYGGTIIRYNYVDNTGWTGVWVVQDFFGLGETSTGYSTQIYNNVFVGEMDMRSTTGEGIYLPDPFLCYNNTFYILNPSGSNCGVIARVKPGGASYYNNIHYNTTSMSFVGMNVNAAGTWDYNCYYGTDGYAYGYYPTDTSIGPLTNVATLSAWRAGMSVACDTHALNETDPLLAKPGTTGPSNYALQSGSPCVGAGRVGGVSTGEAVDMGAWGGTDVNTSLPVAQMGCSFAPGSTSAASGSADPDAPVLTVS